MGGLLRLAHISPTALTLKKGTDKATATAFTNTAEYEVRPEGVFIFADATELQEGDKLWASYTYGEYAQIEAITTKAPELELTFGGLNEADSGNAMLVEVWRASQGITKQLTLLGKGFGALDVEGSVMQDPRRTGTGISKYYRSTMV